MVLLQWVVPFSIYSDFFQLSPSLFSICRQVAKANLIAAERSAVSRKKLINTNKPGGSQRKMQSNKKQRIKIFPGGHFIPG